MAAAAVSFLVPQRIKVEGHQRYVVEFREDGRGTRAFPFTVTTDPPRTLVEPDPAFLDAMLPMDRLVAQDVIRLVRQFHNTRQHFLTHPAASVLADE